VSSTKIPLRVVRGASGSHLIPYLFDQGGACGKPLFTLVAHMGDALRGVKPALRTSA